MLPTPIGPTDIRPPRVPEQPICIACQRAGRIARSGAIEDSGGLCIAAGLSCRFGGCDWRGSRLLRGRDQSIAGRFARCAILVGPGLPRTQGFTEFDVTNARLERVRIFADWLVGHLVIEP
jgi:hypothetical protein